MNTPHRLCDRTLAWRALQGHFEAHGRDLELREAFARDPQRATLFAVEAPEVFADLSKNLWDLATRKLLIEMAGECGLAERRDAMLAGEPIKHTEQRAVRHMNLRAGEQAPPEVRAVLKRMQAFCEQIHSGAWRGFSGDRITDIVNIGIGGSDLGPRMANRALIARHHPNLEVHYYSATWRTRTTSEC